MSDATQRLVKRLRDNVRCDICSGKGGWWRCYTCAPAMEDDDL